MKAKKSFQADLESKKGLFLRIGFIVALSVIYMAFQIKSYDAPSLIEFDKTTLLIDDEIVEITKPERPTPPEPPKPEPIMLNIVDDERDDVADINIDVEIRHDEPIEIWEPAKLPEEEIVDDIIVQFPEEEPSFPGGETARLNFLRSNISYPRLAREAGIQGTVYLSFVVEKDGAISNVFVERGVGGGCDEEAVRVTTMMPKWSPGKQGRHPVRVRYYMPIKFVLAD